MTTGRCSPGGHAICRPRCLPPTGRGLRPPPGQPTKTDVALRPSGVGWRRRGEVIDADPQANASAHLGIVDSQPFTLNDVLTINPATRQVAPGMLADAVVHAGEGTVPAGYGPPADATFGEAKLGGHHVDAVPARRRVTRLGREKLIPKGLCRYFAGPCEHAGQCLSPTCYSQWSFVRSQHMDAALRRPRPAAVVPDELRHRSIERKPNRWGSVMVGGFGHSHRDSSRTTRGRRRAGVALTGLLVTLGAGSVTSAYAAAGDLSFVAGNGTPGPATEGPATNSSLNSPTGVAVDAAANVYIADYTNSRVEKVTPAATVPAAPTGLTATPGNGSATLTFTPGSDGGAAASFESSTDGTAWQALPTTGPDADGALTGTVAGLTNGTAYTVAVRAVNIVGAGAPSASTTVTPAPAVVLTPIQAKYAALGGPTSFLGASVGPEFDTPGGRAQRYEHGHIYWSAGTGAHEVHGTILEKFVGFGGVPSFLGYPVTDETGLPGGAVSAFTGGSVYWSMGTGAFEVHGLIGVHYRDLGGPAGLGYPVTDETTTPDGAGRYNHFTGGSIYWTPATGAHEVHGAIRARWAALGWEQGLAGYPVTDETDVPGVPGARMSVFAGTNAAIYWSPATGAHEVYGSIRAFYTDRAGGPAGRLGLPTSGEYATQSGRASNFTHGRLDWNARTGAVTG